MTYLELVLKKALRPIRSEEELDHATEVMDGLTDRFDSLSQEERDYLDVLSDLVHAYEKKHHPIGRLPENIIEAVRQAIGLEEDDSSRDEEIKCFSMRELFDKFLQWEGVHGYTDDLCAIVAYKLDY